MRIGDWSSDVCSSDLTRNTSIAVPPCRRKLLSQWPYGQGKPRIRTAPGCSGRRFPVAPRGVPEYAPSGPIRAQRERETVTGEERPTEPGARTEERRVGKESVIKYHSRRGANHQKTKH